MLQALVGWEHHIVRPSVDAERPRWRCVLPTATWQAHLRTGMAIRSTFPSSVELVVDAVWRGNGDFRSRLRSVLEPGLRYFLRRELGPTAAVHVRIEDCLDETIRAIRQASFPDPERVPNVVRFLMRLKVARWPPVNGNPVWPVAASRDLDLVEAVLSELGPVLREILKAHFLRNESPEEICRKHRILPKFLNWTLRAARMRFFELPTALHPGD